MSCFILFHHWETIEEYKKETRLQDYGDMCTREETYEKIKCLKCNKIEEIHIETKDLKHDWGNWVQGKAEVSSIFTNNYRLSPVQGRWCKRCNKQEIKVV